MLNLILASFFAQHFHGGDPFHIETSPLICSANQWTDFYMIGTYVIKELKGTKDPCQHLW